MVAVAQEFPVGLDDAALTHMVAWGRGFTLEAFFAELRADRAVTWERRFMALETEVHRTMRDRANAERTPGVISTDAQQDVEKETA